MILIGLHPKDLDLETTVLGVPNLVYYQVNQGLEIQSDLTNNFIFKKITKVMLTV